MRGGNLTLTSAPALSSLGVMCFCCPLKMKGQKKKKNIAISKIDPFNRGEWKSLHIYVGWDHVCWVFAIPLSLFFILLFILLHLRVTRCKKGASHIILDPGWLARIAARCGTYQLSARCRFCWVWIFSRSQLIVLSAPPPRPCGSMEEHLTTDQRVAGSNPVTDAVFFPSCSIALRRRRMCEEVCCRFYLKERGLGGPGGGGHMCWGPLSVLFFLFLFF